MGVMRPDRHHITGWPFLIWLVGRLGLLAAVACVLAIRSFSPTARPRQGLMLACALAVAAIVGGAFVTPDGASERALLDRIDPASGMLCAMSIFVLSLPIVALLGALMRRAAPTQPRLSALPPGIAAGPCGAFVFAFRSEEHTSELQSLMRISYAVFCLKKKKQRTTTQRLLS